MPLFNPLPPPIVMVADESCTQSGADIRVEQRVAPTRIDRTRTPEELTRMKFGDAIGGDAHRPEVIGLTVSKIVATTEVRVSSAPIGGGLACVWPSVITVTLSAEPVVYVTAVNGRCGFKTTLAHEMRHVAIDHAVIDRYVPVFRREIDGAIDRERVFEPVRAVDLRGRETEIEAVIQHASTDALHLLTAERTAEQDRLDSPQEYARLSRVCRPVQRKPRT